MYNNIIKFSSVLKTLSAKTLLLIVTQSLNSWNTKQTGHIYIYMPQKYWHHLCMSHPKFCFFIFPKLISDSLKWLTAINPRLFCFSFISLWQEKKIQIYIYIQLINSIFFFTWVWFGKRSYGGDFICVVEWRPQSWEHQPEIASPWKQKEEEGHEKFAIAL